MQEKVVRILFALHRLLIDDDGQDLVEYALLAALISTAVIAGAGSVASAINTIFSGISTSLA